MLKVEVQLYEYDEPGGLIHFAIKRVARFSQPGLRVTSIRKQMTKVAGWVYVQVCVDDYSHWSHAEVRPRQTGEEVVKLMQKVVPILQAADVRVKRVLTDNGSCNKSKLFRQAVKRLITHQRYTQPYRSQTNGKAERFIQTPIREWY